MIRFPDWQLRLQQFLGLCGRRQIEFGTHDCALFAADAVCEMTGTDFAEPYRGRYTTYRGGLRILRADGHENHIALAAHHLMQIPVAMALPGDLAVVDGVEGAALGLVQGAAVYVLHPEGHLGLVPLTYASGAFRV